MVVATTEILRRNGVSTADIDVFEVHEAFAATIVKLTRELDLSLEKVNVNGGALGHPMGATSAIMVGMRLTSVSSGRRTCRRRGKRGCSGSVHQALRLICFVGLR